MNTSQLTATIPHDLFNSMVVNNDLNNQDEVDNYVLSLIDTDLRKIAEQDAIDEYYGVTA